MIQLAVFDWNGTLFDDTAHIVESFNKELAVIGHLPISELKHQEHYDTPIKIFFDGLGIDLSLVEENYDDMHKAFHAHYEKIAINAPLRENAKSVLKKLNAEGISCIVLSNHTSSGIIAQLERFGLTEYFDAVLANETGGKNLHHGKQHRLEKYIQDNSLSPETCVIIGDTVEEIRIARSIGIHSVAIIDGANTTERLESAKPDRLISALPDIVDIIKEL